MIVIQTRLTRSGRGMVTISQDQVDSLAGNCYEVIGEDGRNKKVAAVAVVVVILVIKSSPQSWW